MAPYTVLLYTPVGKGIILEHSARLASAFPSSRVNAVLQTARTLEWPNHLPLPPGLLNDLRSPDPRVRYGTLRWALDRYCIALYNGVRRLVRASRSKADIVHLQLVVPWVDVALLPMHGRQSHLVSTVHDVTPHAFKLPKKADIWLRGRCYAACDGLILHSTTNVAQYREVYGSVHGRSTVIPLGLVWHGPVTESQQGEAKRRLGLPGNRPVVLMFGELRPNKGLPVLLDAFAHLVADNRDALLLVAGSIHPSVDLAPIEERFAALPADSYRWQKEWIPDHEVELYFQAASVVVLPYTHFGSQSGVLARAYSYACPVVVSDVGSLGETVRTDGSGQIVPAGVPLALAAAIAKVLSDPDLRTELEHNIADAAQTRYSWPRIAGLTLEFYESLLCG